MLALSRKQNEAIVVGNDIEITVLEIKGDQVKVGITAPRNLQIYRKEIYDLILKENKESASDRNQVANIKKLFQ